MKTKVLILIISVLTITLSSCGDKEVSINTIPITAMAVETGIDVELKEKIDFSNPVLMEGSSFGLMFKSLQSSQRFEDMLKFTSSASVEKFGKKEILNFYEKMHFSYDTKLKSKKDNPDKTITLAYKKEVMAGTGLLYINIIIENDTAKIILDNLKNL